MEGLLICKVSGQKLVGKSVFENSPVSEFLSVTQGLSSASEYILTSRAHVLFCTIHSTIRQEVISAKS